MHQNLMGKPLDGFSEFATIVAAQGAVLLKNDNAALPLRPEDTIALFGRTQIDYYCSGTGSGGAVNIVEKCNFLEAMRTRCAARLNPVLAQKYEQWVGENPFDNGGGGWAQEPWFQQEMPLQEDEVALAKSISQKAVVVIGRTAGEDKDNADVAGGYRLTPNEFSLLACVCRHFNDVIVVLNISFIIDMSWLEAPELRGRIGAILCAWHGGAFGAQAVAALLCGEVTPCGKLTDSIAYSLEDSRHASGGSTYFFYSYYSYILFFMCFVFIIFLVII